MDQEFERLYKEFEKYRAKEIWLEGEDGYVDVVDRITIVSVELNGEYTYNALYRFCFTDGSDRLYRIAYHVIKDSAAMGNDWAIRLFEIIDPMHVKLYGF